MSLVEVALISLLYVESRQHFVVAVFVKKVELGLSEDA